MNTNLIEKFNGEINSVKINNSNIFSSIEYILDNMEYNFDISINDTKITTDLVNSITCMVEDYSLPIEEIEDGFDYSIHRANGSIANLKFDDIYVFENVPSLELIAQNIENNKYILEKSNMPKISFSKSKEKSRLER
ncbi:hypothetical protein QP561_08715 [Veillonella nakazawae]|nr:hypothetical protein [Veillonella nakazawae]MDK7740330.1 hypothetical protein [Veillonella nakazawae]